MFGKHLSGELNPMFGKRNELSPRWKGGRKVRRDGYIFVVVQDDHPAPAYTKPSGLKYSLEHRHVMEQHLDRFLHPTEVVHHIDGNRSNNSIDNLALLPDQSTHATLHMEERWAAQDCATHDPEYVRYLWSAAWQRKRQETLERAGYKCERCGKAYKKLAVHHKTYANVRNERPEDLEVLCFACHARITHSQP
jgi:5-methylcytosine-specific restriction endonuclease McrA